MSTRQRFPHHVHNCIVIRTWFRLRWVCIVCDARWTDDRTGWAQFGDHWGTALFTQSLDSTTEA